MFKQAGEIESIITDRDTAAVNDTMNAEGKAILLSKRVVALNEKPKETETYVPNPTRANPTRFTWNSLLGSASLRQFYITQVLNVYKQKTRQ